MKVSNVMWSLSDVQAYANHVRELVIADLRENEDISPDVAEQLMLKTVVLVHNPGWFGKTWRTLLFATAPSEEVFRTDVVRLKAVPKQIPSDRVVGL